MTHTAQALRPQQQQETVAAEQSTVQSKVVPDCPATRPKQEQADEQAAILSLFLF